MQQHLKPQLPSNSIGIKVDSTKKKRLILPKGTVERAIAQKGISKREQGRFLANMKKDKEE